MDCCAYDCHQGRDCPARGLTAAELDRRNAWLNERRSLPDLLLHTGAMQGPYRKTRPLKTTMRMRLARWWRAHVIDWETPKPAP